MTENNKPQFVFLLFLILAVSVLTFFILKPFLYTLILAAVFAVVFKPLYRRVFEFTKHKEGLSVFLTIVFIIIFVLVPLALLGFQIFQEAKSLYSMLSQNDGRDWINGFVGGLVDRAGSVYPDLKNVSLDIGKYSKSVLGWLTQNLGSVFSGLASLLLNALVFLMALYYLLKDGRKIKKTILDVSPLTDSDDESIIGKMEMAINSVVKGNISISVIQGIFATIGFFIFGVPSAVLFGSLAAVAALIPGVGTALVVLPAVAYLFLSGGTGVGIGLLIWWVFGVGFIDNFLGPKLVGKGIKVPPLIILLSVLGGMGLFGMVGFIIGPVVMSLLFALVEVYFSLISKKKS